MRRLFAIVLLSLLALALTACGTGTSAPATPGAGAAGGGATAPAASDAAVSISNLAFVPAQVDVAVGGTVTFTNDDTVDHTVAGDGWSSVVLPPGAKFEHTFDSAGAFQLGCTIHPSMKMTVNVE